MQDILTCAMGLDVHRDVIVACLARGELGTEPEIEIRSFSTLIPEMRKLRDWVLEVECRHVAIRRKQSERKRASRMVNELQKLGYFVVAPD